MRRARVALVLGALTALGLAATAVAQAVNRQERTAQPSGAVPDSSDDIPASVIPPSDEIPASVVLDDPALTAAGEGDGEAAIAAGPAAPLAPPGEKALALAREQLEDSFADLEQPLPVRGEGGAFAVVRALDRTLARVETFELRPGATRQFGALRITHRGCWTADPDDPPEGFVYLEVVDFGKAARRQLATLAPAGATRDSATARVAPRVIKQGWMITSSPAVTGIDHPVYDVWPVRCQGTSSEDEISVARQGAAPARPRSASAPASEPAAPAAAQQATPTAPAGPAPAPTPSDSEPG
jgi:hypothetical protein